MALGAALALPSRNRLCDLFQDQVVVCLCCWIGAGMLKSDVESAIDEALAVMETMTDDPPNLNGLHYREGDLDLVVLTTAGRVLSCMDKVGFMLNQTFAGWRLNHGETAHLVTPIAVSTCGPSLTPHVLFYSFG